MLTTRCLAPASSLAYAPRRDRAVADLSGPRITPCSCFAEGQREDLAPLPVRGEPRGGERPRRGVPVQQGEAGEQPPFLVPGEDP